MNTFKEQYETYLGLEFSIPNRKNDLIYRFGNIDEVESNSASIIQGSETELVLISTILDNIREDKYKIISPNR